MEAINRQHQYRVQRENPSFSSTLLDVIYRSIDERDDKETMRKNRQSIDGCFQVVDNQSIGSVRRNAGTKSSGEPVVRRKSAAAGDIASTCSSSYGLGFPPLEAETIHGFPSRPRPIRTTSSIEDDECNTREEEEPKLKKQIQTDEDLQTEVKIEGKFVKTKSRAMKKIYGYLKQGKQPVSPGARLATFLISLFTAGNAKKSKISSISSSCTGIHDDIIHTNRKSKSADVSTSSSVASFSRSCLSKTPPSSSSRGKLITTGRKRSVRFYPENVILDDYYRPKSLHGNRSDSPAVKFARKSFNDEIRKHLTEKNLQIEETTRNLLKNYQKKVEFVFDSIKMNTENDEDYVDVDDDDDDEAGSYASSDLFELDHLSAIGKDLCMEELPLYETTSIDANRAIANGFLE